MNLDLQKNCNDSMKIPTYSPTISPIIIFITYFLATPCGMEDLVPRLETEPVSHTLGARYNHWKL